MDYGLVNGVRVSLYYMGYREGYRAGEVDAELGGDSRLHELDAPADFSGNAEAYREAMLWGYRNGKEGLDPHEECTVVMHLDNDFNI